MFVVVDKKRNNVIKHYKKEKMTRATKIERLLIL